MQDWPPFAKKEGVELRGLNIHFRLFTVKVSV